MHTSSEKWQEALLPHTSTIREAIINLDRSALQIALVVDSEGLLLGTLTDGDIRRGLLRGLAMDHSVTDIHKINPLIVPSDLGREAVLQLMRANKIHQLPVIDETRRVRGLHLLDELLGPVERPNTMVVMAGGKGTRLRPHTENCPKPLLQVAGKPMLEHILERAILDGLQHFIFAIHYLGEMIEAHFGDGSRWNVRIDYLREDSPLGTAGALSLLQNEFSAPMVITNGDVMTDVRYGEILDFHAIHQAEATMAVRVYELQNPFGVVKTSGLLITGFEEKPIIRSHVNAGIYVLQPTALSLLVPSAHCDMPTLFERISNQGASTIVYPIHEPWLDVGRPEDFESAQSQFLK